MLLEYNKKFNRTADSSCFDFYLIKELEIEKTEAILLPKTPHSLRLRYTLITFVCLFVTRFRSTTNNRPNVL